VLDFAAGLLNSEGLAPHGVCLTWRPDVFWTLAVGGSLIALSYFSIPVALVYFRARHPGQRFALLAALFFVVFLMCGTTHALDVWTLWIPAYGLQAFVTVATALASVTTAVALWWLIPYALTLPTHRDLEFKNTEIRRSEERYRLLIDGVQDYAIFHVSPDGLVETWNTPAERIKGYKAEEIIGRHISCFYTPEDVTAGMPESVLAIARRDGRCEESGWRMRRDGSRFWANAVITALHDDAGALSGFAKITRDLTERRALELELKRTNAELEQLASVATHDLHQTAKALTASEGQLRLAIESAPAAIAMFDRNMRYLAVSRRYAEDYGIEFEGLVGRGHYDVFPEVSDRWRDIHRRCLAGATERCAEDPFPRADGMTDWLSWEIRPWYDANGDVGGIALFSETITWRKQVEETLRESEKKFRLLADAIPQLAWTARADGYIYWYNERWYEYTGTTPEQMEGWGWQRVHDQNVLPAVLERWTASIATGKPFGMTFPLRGADGQFRPFLTRVMPLMDPEGRVVQWFGTNTEIAEQKEMEDALRQAKAEAERANLAKSKFLAAASHDLRQPVQALVLLLEVLKPQVSTPSVARAVGMMETALEGLNGLLTSILDVSRIDAGVVTPQMQNIDVGGMLHRFCAEYAPLCGQKELRLRCRCKPERNARTDAALLERVMRNLIENAVRYTDRGGVLVGARRRGDRLRIDIVDSGMGIPADKLEHVFEEFYQVGNPARDPKQGLGLGLAIVSRLARLIGAEVAVRSREGRGTCFTLLLPSQLPSGAVQVASAPSAATDVFTGRRIIVIEDNPAVRTGLQLMLEGWNCDVVAAETGEAALEAGEREGWRFDAIIADHRLGAGMSGTQTATEMGRRAGRPIPALVVTGDTAPERIEEVHASGFEVMHKPVTPDELARRVARLLRFG